MRPDYAVAAEGSSRAVTFWKKPPKKAVKNPAHKIDFIKLKQEVLTLGFC